MSERPPESQPESARVRHEVQDDRNCAGCSYNLRGLPVDGRCPECGFSIQRSLMGSLLRYSSAEYLQTLQRGVLLLIIAAFASVGIALFTIALEVVVAVVSGFQAGGGPAGNLPAGISTLLGGISDVNEFLAFGAEAIGAIVAIVGWYMLSTEDPSFVGTDNGSKARRAVRILTIVRFVAVVAGLVFLGIAHLVQLPMEVMLVGGVMASGVPALAWAAVTIVGMLYIAWLARRLPDEVMAVRARRYAWLLPVIYVVLICCVGLGPLIALVLYVILLFQLRAALVKTVLWQESADGRAVLEHVLGGE